MTKKLITTTYNLQIRGRFVRFFRSDLFNYPMVEIKLTQDFGPHKKGDVIAENYNSCVLVSSLKFNKVGRGGGSMIDWIEPVN